MKTILCSVASIALALGPLSATTNAAFHFSGRVVDAEGQDFGVIEQLEGGDRDFDLAGEDFGIVGAFRALADFAGNADDAFAAQGSGAVEKVFG